MEVTALLRPFIYEPTTFITDLILAGMSVYFGTRLSAVYWQTFHPFHFNLMVGLYLLGMGALLGGIAHGFGPLLSQVLKEIVWKTTLILIGLTTCYILLSALAAVFPFEQYTLLRWIAFLVTGVYVFIIIRDSDFANVIRFYAPMLIIVCLLMLYLFLEGDHTGSGLFLTGLIVTLTGAVMHMKGVSIHRHFNHNDLYHVIQMVGLWYIYKGGVMLRF